MNAMFFIMRNNPVRIEEGILGYFKRHPMFHLIFDIFLFVPLKRTFLHEKYDSSFVTLPHKFMHENMYYYIELSLHFSFSA